MRASMGMLLVLGLASLAGAPGQPEGRRAMAKQAGKPIIKKLGTIDCDLVETTPLLFRGRLYRFEYVRENYRPNRTGKSYFRFVDVASGEVTAPFAAGYHLGSAYAEGDTAYVYGVAAWGGSEIAVFWSRDLRTWSSGTALSLPGWGIFNTSVCKGDGRYVMAFEIDRPPEETGAPFTMRFAESRDLRGWQLTPPECVFSKDRYTACPALRYLDGRYYMIYLEARPGPTYEPHLVRSPDLVHWESSLHNPLMQHSPQDQRIANPRLDQEQRQRIAQATNINNSDVDLCEFGGKTYLYYSWGNQQGNEFLAAAIYDGSLASFLRGYFP